MLTLLFAIMRRLITGAPTNWRLVVSAFVLEFYTIGFIGVSASREATTIRLARTPAEEKFDAYMAYKAYRDYKALHPNVPFERYYEDKTRRHFVPDED